MHALDYGESPLGGRQMFPTDADDIAYLKVARRMVSLGESAELRGCNEGRPSMQQVLMGLLNDHPGHLMFPRKNHWVAFIVWMF